MPSENVVALHPHKAAVLATALRRLDDSLFSIATTTFLALLEGMEDPTVMGPVLEASDWAAEQARRLQGTLDQVMTWYGEGERSTLTGIDLWRTPYDLSFDDPRAAALAAIQARGLLGLVATDDPNERDAPGEPGSAGGPGAQGAPGGLARLATLLDRWRNDAVFAAQLALALPAADVTQLLILEQQWLARGSDPTGRSLGDARHGIFATLATASSMGVLGFGFGDLVRELRPGGDPSGSADDQQSVVDLAPLGLLFVPGSIWGTDLLLDAMRQFVLPLNRSAGDRQVVRVVGATDPRVSILEAVGRQPLAAQQVLAQGNFNDLFAARLTYGDKGKAAASIIASGTNPAGGEPARLNMVQFVHWIAYRRPEVAPVIHEQLGKITAPWIACFRSTSRDGDPTVANPMRELTDETRRNYLDYVADDLSAAVDLRRADLGWVARRFEALAGASIDDAALGLVFDLDARVSKAVHSGVVANLQREDDRFAFDRKIWSYLVSLFADALPMGVDVVTSVGIYIVGDMVKPPSALASDFAKQFPSLLDSDVRKLETAWLAALWLRRDDNGVFDGVAPPPPSLVLGEPPRLMLESEMTRAEHDAWTAWVDGNDLRRRAHFEQLTVRADG